MSTPLISGAWPLTCSIARRHLRHMDGDLAPMPVSLCEDEREPREQCAYRSVFGFDCQRRVAPDDSGVTDDAALWIDRREGDAFGVGEVHLRDLPQRSLPL